MDPFIVIQWGIAVIVGSLAVVVLCATIQNLYEEAEALIREIKINQQLKKDQKKN
jgi:hypothetical protein